MPLQRPALPGMYHWWSGVLVAITSTCWEMRRKLLPLLWKRVQTYVEVGGLAGLETRMPQLLLLRSGIISENPALAVHVKRVPMSLDSNYQRSLLQRKTCFPSSNAYVPSQIFIRSRLYTVSVANTPLE